MRLLNFMALINAFNVGLQLIIAMQNMIRREWFYLSLNYICVVIGIHVIVNHFRMRKKYSKK